MAKQKNKKANELNKLREENELLKLKLMAEFGGEFYSETSIPPDIENIFLKKIQKIQRAHAFAEVVTIHTILGEPYFPPIQSLENKELKIHLNQLKKLLKKHKIILHHYPTVPPEELYRFVTEELFFKKVENLKIRGLKMIFYYEDFYPNYEMDVTSVQHQALMLLFKIEPVPHEMLFDDDMQDENGLQCDMSDLLSRIAQFHSSFVKANIEDIRSKDFFLDKEKKIAYEKLWVYTSMQLEKGKRKKSKVFEVECWLRMNDQEGQWLINRIRFDDLSL
jgi:hypothetical protein